MQPGTTRQEIPDPGQNGLYVVVQPVTGAKSYAIRYRINGRSRKLTIPAEIGLAGARREAANALFEVAQGRDPADIRAQQRQERHAADTFESACAEFFRRDGSKIRSAQKWQRELQRLVFPSLGNHPIGEIRRRDIVQLMDRIEDNNGSGQADMMLAIIRLIMNWYAKRSDDFVSPIVRGMARRKASEHARSRILDDAELRRVWQAADATQDPFGAFVQFLLLTAARRSEAALMRRGEIVATDWTLPAARNKVKRDLVRPLSAAALAVLARVPRIAGSDLVFTATGEPLGGFSRRKTDFDRACGVSNWTLHDLRRTSRSLMSRAGVPSEHAERCLGHVISGVEGIYDRHKYIDEMRLAYEKLAALLETIVNPRPNVVAMARS